MNECRAYFPSLEAWLGVLMLKQDVSGLDMMELLPGDFRAKLPPLEAKGWQLMKIKKVTVDLTSGFAYAKSKHVSTGLPHLRPYNIGTNGEVDLTKLAIIPREAVDLETYALKRGDVLFKVNG